MAGGPITGVFALSLVCQVSPPESNHSPLEITKGLGAKPGDPVSVPSLVSLSPLALGPTENFLVTSAPLSAPCCRKDFLLSH